MLVTFLGQPLLSHGGWTADELTHLLASGDYRRMDVASAWAKRSGLTRVASSIAAFRTRGGTATLVVGIDEGGATRQGLELARALFDSVSVFHDPGPGRRTFHPKVYLFTGDDAAAVVVGSSNATAGGLFSNYEASVLCQLDLTRDADAQLVREVQDWFASLQADREVCKPLTAALLRELIRDRRYRVADEDVRHRNDPSHDYDGVSTDPPGSSLFGRSGTAKAGLAPGRISTRGPASRRGPALARRRPGGAAAAAPAATPRRRWWKPLTRSDAQQVNPGSNPTGKIQLTKGTHDIDQTTYFRDVFFAGVNWQVTSMPRGDKLKADVEFEVTIEGKPRGRYILTVDHADFRVANQRNSPTWLHWGTLAPILRTNDFSGYFVQLEQLEDATYRLALSRMQPWLR